MPAASATSAPSIGPAPPKGISVSSLACTPARASSCSIGTSMPLTATRSTPRASASTERPNWSATGCAAARASEMSGAIAP